MFTVAERNALFSHLEKTRKNAVCLCGNDDFAVDGPYLLHRQNAGGKVLSNAAIVCTKCGATTFINLVIAGVIEAG